MQIFEFNHGGRSVALNIVAKNPFVQGEIIEFDYTTSENMLRNMDKVLTLGSAFIPFPVLGGELLVRRDLLLHMNGQLQDETFTDGPEGFDAEGINFSAMALTIADDTDGREFVINSIEETHVRWKAISSQTAPRGFVELHAEDDIISHVNIEAIIGCFIPTGAAYDWQKSQA